MGQMSRNQDWVACVTDNNLYLLKSNNIIYQCRQHVAYSTAANKQQYLTSELN